ncbi:MAG: site-specific DNA-methyltransferase [Prevotella sp.]|nr:site-specific DNA-methyltransferase [Prevotella sp.]
MGIGQGEHIRIMTETHEELAIKVRELQKEVERLNAQLKEKRFGLTWIDVPEAFEKESENSIPVLEEVPELAIHNDDGKPTHILIEGDNYHALKSLNYTHQGIIDIIYIDPPYNTGNDGFKYKDSRFLDEYPDGTKIPTNHPLRHSVWLSFMRKRLLLVQNILKNDGVIFISIGDDELSNLTVLCDSLFERVAIVPRIAKRGSDQGTHFRPTKDYVLVYTKNKSALKGFMDCLMSEERTYPYTDENGRKYRKGHSLYQASLDPMRGCRNQRYFIEAPDGTLIIPPGDNFPEEKVDGGKQVPQNRSDKVWRWSDKSYMANKDIIMFDKSARSPLVDSNGKHTDWNVYEKKFKDEELENVENPLPNDVLYDFINTLGTTRLSKIDIDFQYSKPFELVKYLIQITNKSKNALILDFFAGSGTTMEATLQLNEDDGGNRQCILCQEDENNICQNITYERNKRIMNGYTSSSGIITIPIGNSLKYYKTAFVGKNHPKAATDDDKLVLAKKAGCLLSLAENTLYETEVTDYYQIFNDEKGRWTCIYFQEDYSRFEEFRKKVLALDGKEKSVYVFCWTDGAEFATEFEFEKNVTVKSIPQPILDIYKSLNA